MRQRAALARTLAVDPSVLLLDEPFSAVDAQTRIMLQHDLAQTLMKPAKTALLITHDLAGSRYPVRPRAGDEPAARPHHRGDHHRHSANRDHPLERRARSEASQAMSSRLMDSFDIGEHDAQEHHVWSRC